MHLSDVHLLCQVCICQARNCQARICRVHISLSSNLSYDLALLWSRFAVASLFCGLDKRLHVRRIPDAVTIAVLQACTYRRAFRLSRQLPKANCPFTAMSEIGVLLVKL
jgi:hypothetical protein